MKKKIIRGNYNEILISYLSKRNQQLVFNLMRGAQKSKKVDEHGNWNFEAKFDKYGRGYSLNWDLYGMGRDFHTKRFLMVVQIRYYAKYTKRGFPNIGKTYFLVGRNEDKTIFAHPVESRVIHKAIKSDKDVVYAVQSWMFGTDYKNVKRQGDIALIPTKKGLGRRLDENEIVIENSHQLKADEILVKATNLYYANNPILIHQPGTHPTVSSLGWNKVFISKRNEHRRYASQTID